MVHCVTHQCYICRYHVLPIIYLALIKPDERIRSRIREYALRYTAKCSLAFWLLSNFSLFHKVLHTVQKVPTKRQSLSYQALFLLPTDSLRYVYHYYMFLIRKKNRLLVICWVWWRFSELYSSFCFVNNIILTLFTKIKKKKLKYIYVFNQPIVFEIKKNL